ncbi:MAG: bifunctional folylpolyglutamate synthase/dihydrofolate synthase [Erysipelotrichaceae bacterium]|jgi:dihydrofolate synthase/folylpolyglutamate synthase|nr:bifunctional folylpolyglutamate synthase/dihydrofolate synthase [Erysipelotrichaceae bacterium]
MFKSAQDLIAAIITRKRFDHSSLDYFKAALKEMGDPQNGLRMLHVAGTNGKGSTTNYLRSLLQSAGYKTGSFTSPHLVVHNDRIRINDINISDQDLLYYGNLTYPLWQKYSLAMFEIDTLISFLYFQDHQVDFAVYEVGLGGRLDATNVITPLITVITNIGYDHTELLGETLPLIAKEKAGIIKEHIPLFTSERKPECLKVFQEVCKDRHASMQRIEALPPKRVKDHLVLLDDKRGELPLSTLAYYQCENATLALRVIEYLADQNIIAITNKEIKEGLAARWLGRFEIIRNNPLFILDGAHNQEGIEALAISLQECPRPRRVVFSALRDKPYTSMLQRLKEVCDQVIVTQFEFYRAQSAKDLAAGVDVIIEPDYEKAIQKALDQSPEGTVAVTGSLYFISEVRWKFLENEKNQV